MNHLDDELSQTLRRHAENIPGWPGAPLAFDDVRGKATSIRRRRQLAAGVGALAAVAVIVPTAMFASKGLNTSEPPIAGTPTVSDTSSPDPTSTPTMGTDPHALDVADLPTGAPPAWSLVTNGDLAVAHTEDAAIRWTRQGVVVETAGETFGPYPSSSGLARNQAATAVAWATDDGNVMVWADGGDEPATIQTDFGASGVEVAAITGSDCLGSDADCLYYVNRYDLEAQGPESVLMHGDGSVEPVDPERTIINVNDATDDGRVLGQTEIRDDGSCSVVLGAFDTCDHTLDAFSPTGDYVLASDPYHSGNGSGVIAIYDARTGELLANRIKKTEGLAFYNSAVWEDDTHVLFSAFQDGSWSIVRMDVTGAMEYAQAPEKGDWEEVPWRFETR